MNKQALIQKIKSITDLSSEEKAELISLVNNTKKYGLVWEEKFEQIEEELKTKLPVLRVVKERFIQGRRKPRAEEGDDLFNQSEDSNSEFDTPDFPNHILIEGDNLHALTALSFTHKGAIDVIYIDPPYNTGNKDFKYDDSFVDKEDDFRHSKWLSFISKRLEIAKTLLKLRGVIFISIDDNEQAQLKLLADEIFGENNFVGMFTWIKKKKGSHLSKTIRSMTEYVLCYSSQLEGLELVGERAYADKQQPLVKRTNSSKLLRFKTGTVKTTLPDGVYAAQRYGRGTSSISVEEPFNVINGVVDSELTVTAPFVWTQAKLDEEVEFGTKVHLSKMFGFNVLRHNQADKVKRPSSLVNVEIGVGTNEDAHQEILDIFQREGVMTYPKPSSLVKYLLSTVPSNSSKEYSPVILDFFAGSGTTLHATMQLNAEDGGKRQCILVTNNENNICEEVTYERNKRVIQGYTTTKGEKVPGLTENNLRYYQCDYVPSERTEVNRRKLTEAGTELLMIKEDCYEDVTAQYHLHPRHCKLFTNGRGKYLAVIYHSRQPQAVNEAMCSAIAALSDLSGKVRLYGFSPEIEVLLEDFFEVRDRITAVPLPDAIYNAYRATFKTMGLGTRQKPAQEEMASQLEETDLFNQTADQN